MITQHKYLIINRNGEDYRKSKAVDHKKDGVWLQAVLRIQGIRNWSNESSKSMNTISK